MWIVKDLLVLNGRNNLTPQNFFSSSIAEWITNELNFLWLQSYIDDLISMS